MCSIATSQLQGPQLTNKQTFAHGCTEGHTALGPLRTMASKMRPHNIADEESEQRTNLLAIYINNRHVKNVSLLRFIQAEWVLIVNEFLGKCIPTSQQTFLVKTPLGTWSSTMCVLKMDKVILMNIF